MPSLIERDRLVAGYAALAIAIHALEATLPTPLPGVKPGLANVIVLIVLLRHGIGAAAAVALLRVAVGSLLLGTLFAPTFWLALGGTLASVAALALGATWNRLAPTFALSALGLSVLAALAHMSGQCTVAGLLFLPEGAVAALLPWLLAVALVFGCVSGWVAAEILGRLRPIEDLPAPEAKSILVP
jgi:heptaprenyl diphosphate synthase